jgi:hypothetical protein
LGTQKAEEAGPHSSSPFDCSLHLKWSYNYYVDIMKTSCSPPRSF